MWWTLTACGPKPTDFEWRTDGEDRLPTDVVALHSADPDDHTGADLHTGEACVPPQGYEVLFGTDVAVPGDVVDLLAYADTPSWPTAVPERVDGSRPLLFSDSPETVDGPGVLYEDALTGPGRLYLYHTSGANPLRYSILARGVGGPATVTVAASGLAGPSADYVYTGRVAALRWLTAGLVPAPRVVTAPEGAWVELDPALDQRVAPDRLIHGLWDVEVDGAADVRFVAVADGDDPVALADTLSPLPRDVHDRGTFLPADREVHLPCVDAGRGSFRYRLGDGVDDPFAEGTDALVGTPEVLHGNYGVRYTLTSRVDSSDGRLLAVFLAPRGGPLAGASVVSDGLFRGGVADFPREEDDVRPGYAVLLQVWDAAHPDLSITWTPSGGSTLPVDVLFVSFRP